MTALVKVPRAKRSRAKPFNDWAVPAYLTAVFTPKISLFLQHSFKVLHLKDLNRHLECKFQPRKRRILQNKKVIHRLTDC